MQDANIRLPFTASHVVSYDSKHPICRTACRFILAVIPKATISLSWRFADDHPRRKRSAQLWAGGPKERQRRQPAGQDSRSQFRGQCPERCHILVFPIKLPAKGQSTHLLTYLHECKATIEKHGASFTKDLCGMQEVLYCTSTPFKGPMLIFACAAGRS